MIIFDIYELEWINRLQKDMIRLGYFFDKKETEGKFNAWLKGHYKKSVDSGVITVDSIAK
jgi:hypothetical protein